MTDHQTPHRQAWLRDLQPRPIVEDTTVAVLAALAFLAVLYII